MQNGGARVYMTSTVILFLMVCVILSPAIFPASCLTTIIDNQNKQQVMSSPRRDLPPVVLVHVGTDLRVFPQYMSESIRQIHRWNPTLAIIVVISRTYSAEDTTVGRMLDSSLTEDAKYWADHVTIVGLEDIPISARRATYMETSQLDTEYESGFWKYTTERLFVLADVMEYLGLEEVFHLENDNMLYVDFSRIVDQMRSSYPGLACTYIGQGYATAGFFYVHQLSSLLRFLDDVLNNPDSNDMESLWNYAAAAGSEELSLLPIDPPKTHMVALEDEQGDMQGIFDGAGHGQFLGGTHHGQSGGPGFINPFTKVDQYMYRWKHDPITSLRRPYVALKQRPLNTTSDEAWVPIFNLHIHSKELSLFSS